MRCLIFPVYMIKAQELNDNFTTLNINEKLNLLMQTICHQFQLGSCVSKDDFKTKGIFIKNILDKTCNKVCNIVFYKSETAGSQCNCMFCMCVCMYILI